MPTECSAHLEFDLLPKKQVVANFEGGRLTSDGGLALVAQLDRRLGLTDRLAACLVDQRDPSRIQLSYHDILRQRIYGIVAGYEDGNDHDVLRGDPMLKLATGKAPVSGRDLASQPTISRFENQPTREELIALSYAIVDDFIDLHEPRSPREMVLDFDATDDPTHGQQELEFYHGYYRRHCYLPLFVFASCDGGAQEPLAGILRPGNSGGARGVPAILRRLVEHLRRAFPNTRFMFRGDSGMAGPLTYRTAERLGIDYVIGLATNCRLSELAAELVARAQEQFAATDEKVRIFGEVRYQADSWKRPRRVIIKGEVMPSHPDDPNVRFVVTNIEDGSPEELYEFYVQRGDPEKRIGELKNGCASGRTSCSGFLPNQFRLLMHLAAYRLLVVFRADLADPKLRVAQVETLRRKLLKVAAFITESVRRVVVRLASNYPWKDDWLAAAAVAKGGRG